MNFHNKVQLKWIIRIENALKCQGLTLRSTGLTLEAGLRTVYICRGLKPQNEKEHLPGVLFPYYSELWYNTIRNYSEEKIYEEELKKLAKISTAVIGIYLLFLVVIGVKTALLCHDFSKIGMIGINLSAGAKNLDDYISGYAMVPGAFFYAALEAVFSGVIFFPADVRNCVLPALFSWYISSYPVYWSGKKNCEPMRCWNWLWLLWDCCFQSFY